MPILKCSTAGNRRLKEIGLQTFTIRTELEKDWRKALVRVAEIGYRNLEMGGPLGGLSVKEFLAFLKETGLTVLSGGTSMSGFAESADRIIEESLEMGKKYLICFWPWTDSAEGKTLDDWKAMSESLNRIGEKAKKAGLSFGYHNHDLEFQVTEGKIPFDTVLEYTDPDLVFIE